MTFRQAVEQTPYLEQAWQVGLQALRAEDRPHVRPENTQNLRGSADIDKALVKKEPRANRWDFAIAYQHTNLENEFIYWVETHTGSDNQVKVVLKKFEWLKSWLRQNGWHFKGFMQDFYWVASGATSFTKGSRQVKILASKGLLYSGSVLRIQNEYSTRRR